VMIPDRYKTVRTVLRQYYDDTRIILVVILNLLLIPSNINQYQVCRYC